VKRFEDRVAAITGAGSGIGRALAVELSSRGAHLAISDIDEVGLAETAARCEGRGVKVSTRRLDVADRADVEAWADEVVEHHGSANLIVNNAGVALGADVATMRYEDFEWLMDIDFWGVVYGTKAFLPHLEASGEGHVVNISSVFGLMAIPSQSAYNAAKFAVRGFTDALRIELEIADSCVSATTIHPGGIATNIARNARMSDALEAFGGDGVAANQEFEKMLRMPPEKAAVKILDSVARNKRRATIGGDAKVFDMVSRLPAAFSQKALIQSARRRYGREADDS